MYTTHNSLRRIFVLLLLVVLSLTGIASVSASTFPEVIPLPNGFQPEGIASGNGTTFYVGSIPTGAIYRGDLRTGTGEILVQPQPGHSSIGLKFDPRSNLLFVAGGATGKAFIYDAETGNLVAEVQLSTDPSFINDVVITRDAVYFTNSSQPVIYRIPLEKNGQPVTSGVETIPLTGEYQFTSGVLNGNGIVATPNGKTLIVVNTAEGALYRVDPETGFATRIDLGSENVVNGDGLLLQGKTLYVVQNFSNQIAVVDLSPDLTSGTIERLITNPLFDIPTTIARFGNSLYVVNARFSTPPTPDTSYFVLRVPIK